MTLSCRSAGAQARLSATDAMKVAGDGLVVVLPMYDSEQIFLLCREPDELGLT